MMLIVCTVHVFGGIFAAIKEGYFLLMSVVVGAIFY